MDVYGDVLWIVNFIVDYWLLAGTAAVLQLGHRPKRLAAAAALGAMGCLAALLAGGCWAALLGFLLPGLLTRTAFGAAGWRIWGKRTLVFCVLSWGVAGGVLGSLLLLPAAGDVWQGGRIGWIHLAVLLAGGSLVLQLAAAAVAGCTALTSYRYRVSCRLNGRSVEVTALLDSGNQLCSIGRHRPVHIIALDAALPLLSLETAVFLQERPPECWLADLAACRDAEWLARVQPVPCRTLGWQGMLLAFACDELVIENAAEASRQPQALLALYGGRLDADCSWGMLLHPQGLSKGRDGQLCA